MLGDLYDQVAALGNPFYKPPSPQTGGPARPYFDFTPVPADETAPDTRLPVSVYPPTPFVFLRSVDLVLALDISQVLSLFFFFTFAFFSVFFLTFCSTASTASGQGPFGQRRISGFQAANRQLHQ
jgi:hypothetical protein